MFFVVQVVLALTLQAILNKTSNPGERIKATRLVKLLSCFFKWL